MKRSSPLLAFLRFLERHVSLTVLLVVFLGAIAASKPHPVTGTLTFLRAENLANLARQVSEMGILAVGMTGVILTAGIDLSVGSVLCLSSMTAAMALHPAYFGGSWPGAAAALLALLAGTLAGLANGLIIAFWRIPAFVMTLAMMSIARGLPRYLASNQSISIDGLSPLVDFLGEGTIPGTGIKVVVVLFLLSALSMGFLLGWTRTGRHIYAVGGNEEAARYAGLPTRRILVLVYTLMGFFAGLAGLAHAAQNGQGAPTDGETYELIAIAAVVIGGTSLFGGKGSILGTIVGTLIIGILNNIMGLRGISKEMQLILLGIIIVAAVKLPDLLHWFVLRLEKREKSP